MRRTMETVGNPDELRFGCGHGGTGDGATREALSAGPSLLLPLRADRFTGVRAFETQIHERDAYKALFSFEGTLSSLDRGSVRNVAEAIINARAFAGELIAMLREIAQTQTAQVA